MLLMRHQDFPGVERVQREMIEVLADDHRGDLPVSTTSALIVLRLPRIGRQTAGLFMKLVEPTALSPTGRRWA